MRLVLIDTCIWVPFFSRPQSAEKQNVDALLDDDRATLIGPIVTEILQGIPREPQAAYIASLLRGLRCLEMEWEDWLEAARLGALGWEPVGIATRGDGEVHLAFKRPLPPGALPEGE